MNVNPFQCGARLFKVPYWHLEKYSPVLLRLVDSDTDGTGGTSDDTAIPIDSLVSAEEFVIFLDFFYCGSVPVNANNDLVQLTSCLSILRKKIPTTEWCELLAISSKLNCKAVRARAIDELITQKDRVSPVDRIELGNKYNIPQWLPEAYADVFVRESHLTIEEGKKLGLGVTVKVLKGRDACKRNGWRLKTTLGVSQLVDEIFPPPNSPVSWAQLNKLQRRSHGGRPGHQWSSLSG